MEKKLTKVEVKLLKKLGCTSVEIKKAKKSFERGIDSNLSVFIRYLLTFFQFLRFGVAGLVAAALHIGTLVFLVEVFLISPILASAIGFILAVLSSYIINYKITFSTKSYSHIKIFPKFFIVGLVGLGINTGIMYLTINIIGLWYLLGQLCTILIVPAVNFVLNRFWTFK